MMPPILLERRGRVKDGTLEKLLGIVVERSDANGRGAVSMPYDDRHQNIYGTAHGGAVFTLADMAFGIGCRGAGLVCVSSQCSISYLLPGQCGPLRAEAEPVRLGRHLVVYDIMVYDGKGQAIAKAVMTGYVMRTLAGGESHA